jgi:hypothetical protein
MLCEDRCTGFVSSIPRRLGRRLGDAGHFLSHRFYLDQLEHYVTLKKNVADELPVFYVLKNIQNTFYFLDDCHWNYIFHCISY